MGVRLLEAELNSKKPSSSRPKGHETNNMHRLLAASFSVSSHERCKQAVVRLRLGITLPDATLAFLPTP
ncbi:hypothetical protein [Dyella subtropica]|uniref:hypothetical protein n=1 Tax=Dyella subtropica TaxID=2992127 RepID=UPI0022514A5A|nr:hypothetical protein [Dyella subtropica]